MQDFLFFIKKTLPWILPRFTISCNPEYILQTWLSYCANPPNGHPIKYDESYRMTVSRTTSQHPVHEHNAEISVCINVTIMGTSWADTWRRKPWHLWEHKERRCQICNNYFNCQGHYSSALQWIENDSYKKSSHYFLTITYNFVLPNNHKKILHK